MTCKTKLLKILSMVMLLPSRGGRCGQYLEGLTEPSQSGRNVGIPDMIKQLAL